MRTMLVIGATREDAYAFVGQRPDAPPGTESAPDRPSLRVPEDIWPTGETFTGYFMAADGWPRVDERGPVDLLIVTAAARAAYGVDEATLRAWAATEPAILRPGGALYLQPEG
jgi:hypothetical protein